MRYHAALVSCLNHPRVREMCDCASMFFIGGAAGAVACGVLLLVFLKS